MQVLEKYHNDKIKTLKNKDLFDYDSNIAVGTAILKEYLKQKDNDLKKALVKYSGNAKLYFTKVTNNKYNLKKYIYKNIEVVFKENEKRLTYM
jgi:soluble lytic murein transglycosylase-like protein